MKMPVLCVRCEKNAILKRPKNGDSLCKVCFFEAFETEVHHTIASNALFTRGDYVAVAASGGKDSTVLAYVMKLLNERYDVTGRAPCTRVCELLFNLPPGTTCDHTSNRAMVYATLA